MMIYGPVQESMQEFNRDGNVTMKAWMTLHEISHSLLEGCNSLVAKGAITIENKNDIHNYATCLSTNKPSDIDSEV